MVRLTINGKTQEVDVDPSTPLLWVLREQVGLTGTKYGCGMAQCGACTVHINGAPTRSCVMPVSAAVGKRITTIEGLASGKTLTKVDYGDDRTNEYVYTVDDAVIVIDTSDEAIATDLAAQLK